MPKTFTDQTATVTGTPLNASNLNNLLTSADVSVASGVPGLDGNSHVLQQAVYDATEAATLDTLGSTSTVINNLNRMRYVLAQMQGVAWTTARAVFKSGGQHALSDSGNVSSSGGNGSSGTPYLIAAGANVCGGVTVPSGTANGAIFQVSTTAVTASSRLFLGLGGATSTLGWNVNGTVISAGSYFQFIIDVYAGSGTTNLTGVVNWFIVN